MFVSQIIDEAAETLGTTDQSKVFRVLTQAVQTLMESGHWFHTNAEIDVCTGWDGCTITLPREVEVPLAVNVDGSPTYFRNRFFQYHINKGGVNNPVSWAWDDRGFVATQMDIIQPSQLIAVAESDNDAGKKIRVLGTDANNVSLRDQTEDGAIVDGIILPIHSKSDFMYGTIQPEQNKVESRQVAIAPFEKFSSETAHKLETGQAVVAQNSIPDDISKNITYYVGVEDETTIKLYNSRLDALSKRYPIQSTNIDNTSLNVVDQRQFNVLTNIFLNELPKVSTSSGFGFTISGDVIPAPLTPESRYYGRTINERTIQIYNSLSDAQQDINPIYLSGTTGTYYTTLRTPAAAQTLLKFSIPHYFKTGDIVKANNNNGTLPTPLVVGQNYYVNVVDDYSVSIHSSYEDSISGKNKISLQTTGTGDNSLVKIIPASAQVGVSSNIRADFITSPISTGSGASVTPVVSGSITSINILNAGTNYTSIPTITFTDVGGAGYTSAPTPVVETTNGSAAVFSVVLTNDYVSSVTATTAGSGYSVGETISFTGGGGRGARAHISSVNSSGGITGIDLDPVGSGLSANVLINTITKVVNGIVIQSEGSGYEAPPRATISGGGGSGATATCILLTSFVSRYIVTNGGSQYNNAPAITISGGGGIGAYGSAIVANGKIVSVKSVAKGSGYTAVPSVGITPSSGAYVSFTSTGTLPSPLREGVVYRAEQPMTSTSFTLKNIDFSEVNITDTGSGTLYLVLSRTYGIDFNDYFQANLSAFSTGDEIYFGTDYILPNTIPAISTTTPYYLNLNEEKTAARVYDTQAHAISGTSVGLISMVALGTGQLYFGQKILSNTIAEESIIVTESQKYIKDGVYVTFQSTGSLPAPLNTNQNYLLKPYKNGFQVWYNQNQRVSFTTFGVGRMFFNIGRDLVPVQSTTIIAKNNLFNTGEEVFTRVAEGEIIDPVLNPDNAPFFVRRVNDSEFELYDTRAHAINTSQTTGRLSYTLIGKTNQSTFFIDTIVAPVFVKKVDHIEKPITDAGVSLYAWDYGRANDATLIGQYHPTETNPQYRRIRIGKSAAWARILYRVKCPTITSIYDYIPIEQPRAIIAAVHAIDLENKDFADQAIRYWQMAQMYLRSQNESMDGHAMTAPQINPITYGDLTDEVMF